MALLTENFFDFLLLLVVAALIGSGRWIFWATPAVVIFAPRAHAVEVSLNPLTYLPNPLDLISASAVDHLLLLIKISIIVIGVLALIFRNACYKIILTYHTGLSNIRSDARFYLEIAFLVTNKQFGKTTKALVTVRVPICQALPPQTVSVLTLRQTNMYTLTRKGLQLAEPLNLRGLNSDGIYIFTGDVRVKVPWSGLRWEKNNPPTTVRRGNNGIATVRVIPDPHALQ